MSLSFEEVAEEQLVALIRGMGISDIEAWTSILTMAQEALDDLENEME